jgi:hypothetical protein
VPVRTKSIGVCIVIVAAAVAPTRHPPKCAAGHTPRSSAACLMGDGLIPPRPRPVRWPDLLIPAAPLDHDPATTGGATPAQRHAYLHASRVGADDHAMKFEGFGEAGLSPVYQGSCAPVSKGSSIRVANRAYSGYRASRPQRVGSARRPSRSASPSTSAPLAIVSRGSMRTAIRPLRRGTRRQTPLPSPDLLKLRRP